MREIALERIFDFALLHNGVTLVGSATNTIGWSARYEGSAVDEKKKS